MRILALTRYAKLGASSRLRFFQYLPYFDNAGIEIAFSPLLPDTYIASLQKGNRNKLEVAAAYFRRIYCLLSGREYDLVWVEKDCLPWIPFLIEMPILGKKCPFALDYDDAVFHQYDLHQSFLARTLLASKHSLLMRNAALVIAGNEYLEKFAISRGAVKTAQLPTAIDLNRYQLRCAEPTESYVQPPCVGWIGQNSTAIYLKPLTRLFKLLQEEGVARFQAIGINPQLHGLSMQAVEWDENTEVDSIREIDIGIMPLSDGPFERGKCGYKLIQYMACGLPVVASPVGMNREIVEHGVNGFLAETEVEWSFALRTLLKDPILRARMGRAGRRKVEEYFCTQITGPRLIALLKQAAGRARIQP
jgi:glycosyltransferase involved in cell wall biosynthesis